MCERCDDLEQQNRELAEMNAELSEEVSGLMIQVRKQAGREAALARELRAVFEADPRAEEIREVLEAWKRLLGHKRAKCPADGKRYKLVRAALRSHTKEELIEALEGLALVPFVGAHGRKPNGKKHERYDDVEHALRDEVTIQRCRGYRERARRASFESLHEVYKASEATAHAHFTALTLAMERDARLREQGREQMGEVA